MVLILYKCNNSNFFYFLYLKYRTKINHLKHKRISKTINAIVKYKLKFLKIYKLIKINIGIKIKQAKIAILVLFSILYKIKNHYDYIIDFNNIFNLTNKMFLLSFF